MSLGKHATLAFARQAASLKEKELNSIEEVNALDPITWQDFRTKNLDTIYPGHELPVTERKLASKKWDKSVKTMLREQLSLNSFTRLISPRWCHDVTDQDRVNFINQRIDEVGSAASVEVELAVLRHVFNILEEWRHRPRDSNPFAGKGKAKVTARRKRNKARESGAETKPSYYSMDQLNLLLRQADKESLDKPDDTNKKRLRALVYFEAYTGARINEALHLEWNDIDFEKGIAWLFFKIENDLKTESSAAPFGLPDVLLAVLKEWKKHQTCSWVFPNSKGKPWVSGGPGYKPLDQLKKLAKRAGIDHATWKMFRHSFNTHGKGRFGMTTEQMRADLRHSSQETQKHYDHADLQNLRSSVKDIDFRSQ